MFLVEVIQLIVLAVLCAWGWWSGGLSLRIHIDASKDPRRALERRLAYLHEEVWRIETKLGKEAVGPQSNQKT